MTKETENLLREIESWNDGDKRRFVDGTVDFDGTFVFAARDRKIQQLRKLLEDK